jgi:hypothetical protein
MGVRTLPFLKFLAAEFSRISDFCVTCDQKTTKSRKSRKSRTCIGRASDYDVGIWFCQFPWDREANFVMATGHKALSEDPLPRRLWRDGWN